jgi:F-type H+-transporting ATPase subunit delta
MNELDKIVDGFLAYLKKEDKLNLFPAIVRKLNSRLDEGFLDCKVLSAVKLTDKQRDGTEKILKRKFGVKEVLFEVDSNMSGGIKVVMGDKIIDLSLENKLNLLKKSL